MHYKEEEHQAVRESLALMLTDPHFKSSPQMSAFISYIVEQTLDGQSDRIKAYTIAVDALGKPDDFDPQSNPSVRVLAKRLRDNLHEYYQANGRQASVKISIKPGSYVPSFEKQEPEMEYSTELPNAVAEEDRNSESLSTYIRMLSSTRSWIEARHRQMTVSGVMLMALFAWTISGNTPNMQENPSQHVDLSLDEHLVAVDIASLEHIGRATDRPHLLRLSLVNTDAQNTDLVSFGRIVSNILNEYENAIVLTEPAGKAVPVEKWPEDYELHYSQTKERTVELVVKHAHSGRIINRREITDYMSENTQASDANTNTAHPFQSFSRELMATNGIILKDYQGNNDLTPTMQCAFLFDAYYADKTRSNRQSAQRCATRLKNSGIISAIPEIL